MATIAVFGATGYAGSAITDEALRRGHSAIGLSRTGPTAAPGSGPSGLVSRPGNLHDAALVDAVAADADVIIVAIRAREADGRKLINAIPELTRVAAARGIRLGIVGGAGSLQVSEGGPALMDTPGFPEAALEEAGSHAEVLAALRETTDDVDWFYLSPAAGFGAHSPGQVTGAYRVGGDVLITDDEGRSAISAADYALALVDEIEQPRHHKTRFSVAH
jgi:putative NADH-flavin reductase